MVNAIANFAIRGFQIIFAAVILGLSVSMIKDQLDGTDSPTTLRYASFVGGISLIAGFVGIAAEFVSILQGKVGLIIDGIIALVNIAGGVLLAIKIGNANCADTSIENRAKLFNNDLFNGGCFNLKDGPHCKNNYSDHTEGGLNSRCKECQADTVFMFFIVVLLLVSSTLNFLRMKKGY